MIKTVIFDIGNVLMNFDWKGYMASRFDEETTEAVNKAIWTNLHWLDLDRGLLNGEEVINATVSEAPEFEASIREAFENAGGCMHKFDYAAPWIKEVKALGFKAYYLSNYSEYLMHANPEVLYFLPLTDGGIFSCHVHLLKPDPAIYELFCRTFGLKKEECLFIDDNRDNIDSAREFGLNAFLFEGYEKSYPEIMALLKKSL